MSANDRTSPAGRVDLHALEERQEQEIARKDLVAVENTAREIAERFPDQSDDAAMTVAVARVGRGDSEGALGALNEALDQGLWWPAQWFSMYRDLLAPLEGNSAYKAVQERAMDLERRAKSHALPPGRILLGGAAPPTSPRLLVLHGRGRNAQNSIHPWSTSLPFVSLLCLARSSQLWSAQRYQWDDLPRSEADLRTLVGDLPQAGEGPSGPLVVGGFSQGASLAIRTALLQTLPVRGFIAVVPTASVPPDGSEPLLDLVPRTVGPSVRGVILAGEKDVSTPATRELHRRLIEAGWTVELEVVPSLGHDYPTDLPKRWPRIFERLEAKGPMGPQTYSTTTRER